MCAGDLLVTNYSFESALANWTQKYGTGGITADATQHYTGSYSCKIVDNSATTQWGIESAELPATASNYYSAQARVYITSGSADLYLRFWNSSHAYLSAVVATKSSPTGSWTYLSAKGQAPAGTAYATVMLYSNSANVGTAYWDDVQVIANYTDLGVQVTNASMHAATMGIGANANKIYSLQDGAEGDWDAAMSIINLDTETVTASYTLAGASGGWGATTATDGQIYFGTYYNAGLYRYTPGGTSMTLLGTPFGDSHIRCLTAGLSGKVYGGTYSSAGYFRYLSGSGITQVGSLPIFAGMSYIQGADYDEATDYSYLGCATPAKLVKLSHANGTTTNILPAQFAGEEFVYTVDVQGGRIFARTTPSNTLVVLNKSNNQLVYSEANGIASMGTTPLLNNKVYYCANATGAPLKAYDTTTDVVTSTGYSPNFYPQRIGLATLADQVNYPGQSVVGIGNAGGNTWVFKYNPATGQSRKFLAPVAETPVTINNIGAGPDQKIYSSGYLTGGTGVYTPNRSDQYVQYDGIMQTYGMQPLNGLMYFATYPNAKLYKYDPAVGWASGRTLLYDMVAEAQSRPVAITTDGSKLYIGTIAEYGQLDGALTIYNPATNTKTVKVGLVNDQGVSALAYYNGKVYGGTSVAGGLGSTPTQADAKFFIYNPATDTTTVRSLPTVVGRSHLTSITALAAASDGRIWGFAEGCLFIYNPSTDMITHIWDKFTDVNYGTAGAWYDAALQPTKDGMLYGTIKQKYLFRIDLSTGNIIQLLNTGANRIAEDGFGNIYYTVDTRLWRYAR